MAVVGLDGNALMHLAYQYDDIGNISAIYDATQGVHGEQLAYQYDHLDRLVNASASGENGYARIYAYDEVGNIIEKGPNDAPRNLHLQRPPAPRRNSRRHRQLQL